jgi:hypothetical protein
MVVGADCLRIITSYVSLALLFPSLQKHPASWAWFGPKAWSHRPARQIEAPYLLGPPSQSDFTPSLDRVPITRGRVQQPSCLRHRSVLTPSVDRGPRHSRAGPHPFLFIYDQACDRAPFLRVDGSSSVRRTRWAPESAISARFGRDESGERFVGGFPSDLR